MKLVDMLRYFLSIYVQEQRGIIVCCTLCAVQLSYLRIAVDYGAYMRRIMYEQRRYMS